MKKIYHGFREILSRFRAIKIQLLGLIHTKQSIVDIRNARLEKDVTVYFRRSGSLKVIGNTLICKHSKIVIDGGELYLGKDSTIGENNIFNVFDKVVLGENTLTADRVSFISNTHHYHDVLAPISRQGGVLAQ